MGPLEATRLRFSSSLRGKTLLIIGLTMFGLVGGLYVLCGALRLARFNVQTATADKSRFVGLPISDFKSVSGGAT